MSDIPQDVIDELIAQYMAEQNAPMTGEQSNFYGAMPMNNLEGDPYTLSNQLNQLQDVNQLIADPVFQGLGGPGAFGAQAFQPRVRWEAVESPEYLRWQNYLNTPESFEGMIAAELEGGGTPYSAIRKIQAAATANPEGPLAQELATLFPERDEVGPGAIDWTMVSEGATKIDELRAAIPPLGNAGGGVAPDGSVIEGGGEVMEIMGPDGRPQLVRRIEEASPLQEKYDELGIPNPLEQYTPGSFLGGEWQAQDEAFQGGQTEIDALTQASQEAYQRYLAEPEVTPTGAGNRPAPQVDNTNYAGTTEEELVGGGGIAAEPDDRAAYDPATGAMGGAYEAPPSMVQMRQIETAAEFEEWYNTNANRLTDDQRFEAVMQAGYNVTNKGPEYAGEWDRIRGLIHDDMTETEGGGGLDQAGDIGGALADLAPEPTESGELLVGAQRRTTEDSLRSYLDENAANMSSDDLSQLGAWASQQNWDIGGELIRGEYQPPGGGGAGSRVQAFNLSPEMEERYTRFLAGQGGEPVPPPGGMALEPNAADDWFSSTGATGGPSGGGTPAPPFAVPEDTMRELMLRQILPGNDQRSTSRPGPDYSMTSATDQLQQQARPGPDYSMPSATDQLQQQAQGGLMQQLMEMFGGQQQPRPGPDYSMPSATDQLQLQAQAQQMGPQVPDDLFMDPGYHNWWGPTDSPFTAYGQNTSYVDPGTTEQQWLYDTGQRTPNVRGPGGWNPYGDRPDQGSFVQQAANIISGQQPRPGPDYGMTSATDQLQAQAEAQPDDPMTAAMISQIIGGARAPGPAVPPPVSLEAATAQVRPSQSESYNVLGGSRTGEHVRRTDAERRAQAAENAPQGLQGEEYNVLGGDRTRRGMKKAAWMGAFQERSHALVARQRQREQLYGAEFGKAVRAYLNAQQAGTSPMQQAYAQRMQNIQSAGIPLGAKPQVVQY